MADAQAKLQFGKSSNTKDPSMGDKPSRRGDFPSISVGIPTAADRRNPEIWPAPPTTKMFSTYSWRLLQ
ncbi:hypothetical protein FPV67DRAFT_1677247 [Lyophyllum atratum]|nr:hypothetical protein FPV67DRAFT_1677247 [Lyophyllum atratum]